MILSIFYSFTQRVYENLLKQSRETNQFMKMEQEILVRPVRPFYLNSDRNSQNFWANAKHRTMYVIKVYPRIS